MSILKDFKQAQKWIRYNLGDTVKLNVQGRTYIIEGILIDNINTEDQIHYRLGIVNSPIRIYRLQSEITDKNIIERSGKIVKDPEFRPEDLAITSINENVVRIYQAAIGEYNGKTYFDWQYFFRDGNNYIDECPEFGLEKYHIDTIGDIPIA